MAQQSATMGDIAARAESKTERLLDEALAETFPASDPIAANLRQPRRTEGSHATARTGD